MGCYKIGKTPPQWSSKAQTITFVVTEDCNLRCKYCYITHKASNKKMSFETAKKFIDYILTADIETADSVIVDFFGGEPFMEVSLVDKISDYFKLKTYELNHPWFWNYRLNFATNGVNYSSYEVQRYIEKNKGKLSIGISIDGIKEKHDLNRIFPDGRGSYDCIEKNIPLWISQFAPATKMTFSSEDLCYLKDSVIDLWKHGVTEVAANVVFENVWKEGDDEIFEAQLRALADYILDNALFDRYYCTLFSDEIGGYMSERRKDSVYCGAGKMLAVGPDGKLYPCVRYKDYSLNRHPERIVGDVQTGIDMELVRPFMAAASRYQDDDECQNCPIAAGCPQCQGLSYDAADTPTNFQRAKYICKMQKARVRANDYFFAVLYNRYGITREFHRETAKMYFLLSDNFKSFCCYDNASVGGESRMDIFMLERGLEFCRQNFMQPVFVHGNEDFLAIDYSRRFEGYHIQHFLSISLQKSSQNLKDKMYIVEHDTIGNVCCQIDNCIYNIRQEEMPYLAADVVQLFHWTNRINVNILELNRSFDENEYTQELIKIKNYILDEYRRTGVIKEINLLTDILFSENWNNCRAGERNFYYAPDGKFYSCPAFYREKIQTAIGCPQDGFDRIQNSQLYSREYHPICQVCDAKQCRICIYRNLKATREINISPSFQCRKAHIERKISSEMQEILPGRAENKLEDLDYTDPISRLPNLRQSRAGYYRYKK